MAMLSAFELFGLPEKFAIDLEALEKAHERAILKVHPDRFAGRPAAERRVAEQWSARINEFFDVLKDPVKRAALLCVAAGHPVDAETITRMPADFLMEQMSWREDLDDAKDESAREAVRDKARARFAECESKLESAIDSEKDWTKAVDLTRRLMFIGRFLEQTSAKSSPML